MRKALTGIPVGLFVGSVGLMLLRLPPDPENRVYVDQHRCTFSSHRDQVSWAVAGRRGELIPPVDYYVCPGHEQPLAVTPQTVTSQGKVAR